MSEQVLDNQIDTNDTNTQAVDDTATGEPTTQAGEPQNEPLQQDDNVGGEVQTTGDNGQGEGEPQDDFSLDIKYNKQHIKLNREDAVRFAQMGKKYEEITPMLDTLKYLASQDNITIEELVNNVKDGIEAEIEQHIRDKATNADGEFDEEIYNALLEADKSKRGKAYEDMLQSEKDRQEKEEQDEIQVLSSEFNYLKSQIPDLQNFDDVPDEVIKLRDENGITLFDAYLRYAYAHGVKVQKEQEQQQLNATSAIGNITPDNSDKGSIDALMRGIWG